MAPAPLPAAPPPLHWGAEALWEALLPLLPGISVEVVASTASTNSALLARVRDAGAPAAATLPFAPPESEHALRRRSRESRAFDAPAASAPAIDLSPCLLVAEQQTGGRGRLGRAWQSRRGASLTFSLALPYSPVGWSGLSLAVGVALAEALDAAHGAPRIGLKWPNDLWLMDAEGDGAASPGRKLGGILIETVATAGQRVAVVGIGLNVLPFAVPDASSGAACLHEIDPGLSAPQALARVAPALLRALQRFEHEGFAPFAAAFAARDLLRGREVNTTLAGASSGVALGVNEAGALLLQTAGGLRELVGGEVSVRLPAPAPAPAPAAGEVAA